jgi:hypothetical protein
VIVILIVCQAFPIAGPKVQADQLNRKTVFVACRRTHGRKVPSEDSTTSIRSGPQVRGVDSRLTGAFPRKRRQKTSSRNRKNLPIPEFAPFSAQPVRGKPLSGGLRIMRSVLRRAEDRVYRRSRAGGNPVPLDFRLRGNDAGLIAGRFPSAARLSRMLRRDERRRVNPNKFGPDVCPPGLMFCPRGSGFVSFASHLRGRIDGPLRPLCECGLTGSDQKKTQWLEAQ